MAYNPLNPNGQKTMANSSPVVIASDQSAIPISGSVTATNPSVGTDGSAIPTSSTLIGGSDGTNLQPLQVDASKNLKTVIQNASLAVTGTFWQATQPVSLATNTPTLQAGSSIVGKVGIDQTTPGTTNAVQTVAGTTGGYSKIKYAAQTTTVQTVKGTVGTLAGYMIYNPNSSVAYVQLFDVATATSVTLGTTVPDVILPIPATSGANILSDTGIAFANGIKLACTTTATGLTAPSTGLDMSIFFK